MKFSAYITLLFFLFGFNTTLFAQADSLAKMKDTTGKKISFLKNIKDSTLKKISSLKNIIRGDTTYDPYTHDAKVAAKRSALLPGWGQIYNKKYWKLPIVYGALGTGAGVFIFNLNWYNRTRYGYRVLLNKDTANYKNVHKDLQFLIKRGDAQTLGYLRRQYRQGVDYSVLIFAVLWALNVVDATVDGHLKSFDVSPNLSFKLKPGYSDLANTAGISLIVAFGNKKR